jgi:hypothetical protein
MKNLFIVLVLLLLPAFLAAKIIPENVTVTGMTADGLNVPANAPFGVGDDGMDHRFHVDNSGNFFISSSGTAGAQAVYHSETYSVAVVTSATAMALNLTNLAGVSYPCEICLEAYGTSGGGTALLSIWGTGGSAPSWWVGTGSGDPNYIGGKSTCYGPLAVGTVFQVLGLNGPIKFSYQVDAWY